MTRRAGIGLAWILAGAASSAAWALPACSNTPAGDSVGEPGLDASADDARAETGPTDAGAPMVDDVVEGSSDAGGDAVDATADGGPAVCPDGGETPDDLSCTGLYSDWATKTIAADAVAYTPGLVFWSDGAVKSRWLYLPAGSKIDTTDMDNWVFPVGTKIWKQFALGAQIVETRLLSKGAYGWSYLDYRWSADATTAKRLDDGETNVNGTSYEIPSTSVCFQCHGGRTDTVLGIDLLGLGVAGAQGVTLASLVAQGSFTKNPVHTTVAIPEDSTTKAAAALGWLHVNCGSACHNTIGVANGSGLHMKLLAGEIYPADGGVGRVSSLDTYTTAVNVEGHVMPGGVTYERIAPGDAAHSLIPLFALSRDPDGGMPQMPPIVSHIPDTAGEAPVSAWINALGDAGP